MKRSVYHVLRLEPAAVLVSALLFCEAPAFAQSSDDVGTLTQDLRGGEVITGFTGVVELSIGGASSCTGNMIGPDIVLTSAHCLTAVGVNNQSNGLGGFVVNYHDPEIGRRQVFNGTANWFAHRDYDASSDLDGPGAVNADIAVVRIPGVFQDTDYQDYLRLYADNNDRLKTRLTAYGAGIYTYSGKTDNNLRTHWFSVEHVKKNHIVIDTRKKVGVCKGDSGGPLMYNIGRPAGSVPVVAGVAGAIEFFGGEPDTCTNNDWGIDDAFYSRTNWEKLQSVMRMAGVQCILLDTENVSYRRCFELPFIESVDFEGLDRGDAVAIVMSAIM